MTTTDKTKIKTKGEAKLKVFIESKAYATADGGKVNVLQNISFEAGEQGILMIVGPSGCGKTTLLNLIAGLDTDYTGHIELPEYDGDASPGTLPGTLPLAFMFQEPRLLPWCTVKQNIDLVRSADATEDCTALLEQMGIADALNQYPSQLSLGMSRRVALARAFSVNAPLLIMDEPFNSIDELIANRLRATLLEQLKMMPRTVLFVTHNIREALYLGTRLLVLSPRPARLLDNIALPGAPGRSAEEIEALRADILKRFPDVLQ